VLLVAMLLGSCGSGKGSPAASRPSGAIPVLAGETHAPGSALADGFRVPPGAVGAGPILPCDIVPAVDLSTCDAGTAYLALDDHPNAVINALLAQGYKMGYHGGVRCGPTADDTRGVHIPNGMYCRGEMHQGPNLAPVPPTTRVPVTPTTGLDKSKVHPPTTLPRPLGRSLTFEVRYGGGGGGGQVRPVALLTIQFASQRSGYDCEYWPPCTRSTTAINVAAPHLPALPRVGDQLDDALESSSVKVLAGTEVVMHVDGTGDVAGAFLTLMKVPHNLDSTVAAYRTAIGRGPYSGGIRDIGERTDRGGWRVHSWTSFGTDGGPEATLSVLRHGTSTYVAVKVVPYA
jgi:hypothetical protein